MSSDERASETKKRASEGSEERAKRTGGSTGEWGKGRGVGGESKKERERADPFSRRVSLSFPSPDPTSRNSPGSRNVSSASQT